MALPTFLAADAEAAGDRLGRCAGGGKDPSPASISYILNDVRPDITDTGEEPRDYRLGSTATGRVLVVVFTVRRAGHVENIRIISARHANRKERAAYVAAKD